VFCLVLFLFFNFLPLSAGARGSLTLAAVVCEREVLKSSSCSSEESDDQVSLLPRVCDSSLDLFVLYFFDISSSEDSDDSDALSKRTLREVFAHLVLCATAKIFPGLISTCLESMDSVDVYNG